MTKVPASPQLPALRRSTALTATPGPRVDRARRMRRTATGMLVLMAAVFVAALRLDNGHPAWGYLIAFTEAAMVGGLADWFAVTANQSARPPTIAASAKARTKPQAGCTPAWDVASA